MATAALVGITAQLAADEWAPVDLGRAALELAGLFCSLDVERELLALDALAERTRPAVLRAAQGVERVRALVEALRGAEGFAGSEDAFEDPRSSFLHEVLRRRTGLPITLALIYTETGRRLGVPLFGISFPGHFLAGFGAGPDAVLDAFAGELLDTDACERRLRAVLGPRAELAPALLEPASPRQILVRMLSNLKHLYAQRGEDEPSLTACQAIFELVPLDPGNLRDRGVLLDRLGHASAALRDLERFAELAPADASLPAVQERISALRHQRTVLN